MAETTDTLWLPVLPSLRGFGPALASGAEKEAEKTGKGVGKKFGLALVGGVAAVGAGAVAAGAALYKVGAVFEDVTRTIRVGSGASGAALDDLVGSAKRIGSKVPAEFDKIAGVVADVNTRMGLTGDTMDTVASQYLEAGRILGEDVDIGKTSAAFSAFKIEGEDVSGALDHLFQVSQATGVGMNELADGAQRNAPAMQTLGFSFEETTAMIGSFDKAGLNSSALMASMSKGLVTLAKDGEEPAAAFKRVQGEIAGFIEKGDEAGALNLASKVFGTKGATQFIGAIKSGALGMDDMSKAAGQTDDTILGLGKETMSFSEQWMVFKNKILVWLEPLATKVFGAMAWAMKELTDGVTAFGSAWEYNDGEITSSGIPGMMEVLGYWARQTFDYFKQTVIPALMSFGNFLKENIDTIKVISGVISALLLPMLIRLGVEAVIAGGKQVVAWATSGGGAVKAAAQYAISSAFMVASWVMMGIQSTIAGVKIAAAWVMAMGPIGWVIAGIAALVAAFVMAYNNIGWFKDGVNAVLQAVGGFFTWLWQNAIKPAFDGIMAVVGAVVTWFQTTALPIIQGAIGVIGSVFTWLWTNIVKPVFGFIQAFIGAAFLVIRGVFQVIVSVIQNVLAPIFMWLWNNVVKPAFQGIGDFIGWVWNTLITPIFTAIKWYIDNVLAPVFTWLWKNVIQPAFDGIGSAISWAWERVIKPAFDFLSKAIKEDVPAAFDKGVAAVKRIWDTILDIAKKPVRFVVDTVINDGLIGAFNKVAKFLPGIDPLPKVALPAGFRSGGYTGRVGRDQIAGVVHGDEHVIRSESRRTIEAAAPGLLERFNQMGAKALAGYRNGGRVNPTKNMGLTQGYHAGHDGIDIGVGVGTPVFATGPGVVSFAGSSPNLGNIWGGNEIRVMGDGLERWFSHLSQIGVRVGQQVSAGQQIGLSGNSGITSGPHLHFGVYAGGYPNSMNPLSYLAGASAPSGGSSGPGWMDPFGALAKLAEGVMGKIRDAIPGGGFMVDVAAGIGKKLFDDVIEWGKGKFGMGASGGAASGGHLNPLLYDQGGILRPGMSSIINATGKPEAILNPQQWADIHRLAIQRGGEDRITITQHFEASNARAEALVKEMAEQSGRQISRTLIGSGLGGVA